MDRTTDNDDDLSPSDDWEQSLTATCNRLSTQYLLLLRAAEAPRQQQAHDPRGKTFNFFLLRNFIVLSSKSIFSHFFIFFRYYFPLSLSLYIPAGGGHVMKAVGDPPPPPLAADVALSTTQALLACENICAATSQLLSLIRTLRLSVLLMDEETIQAEESLETQKAKQHTMQALHQAVELEQELLRQRNTQLHNL